MWALVMLGFLALLLASIFAARRRLNERTACGMVALAFAGAIAYFVWRTEWFNVYRFGVPPLTYFFKTVVAYGVAFGIAGWFLALGLMRFPDYDDSESGPVTASIAAGRHAFRQ